MSSLIPVGFKPDIEALTHRLCIDPSKATVSIDYNALPCDTHSTWGVNVYNKVEGFEYRLDILHEDMPECSTGWGMADVVDYMLEFKHSYTPDVVVNDLMIGILSSDMHGRYEIAKALLDYMREHSLEGYTLLRNFVLSSKWMKARVVYIDGDLHRQVDYEDANDMPSAEPYGMN